MYNYNLINPVNITYRKPQQNPSFTGAAGEDADENSASLNKPVSLDENRGGERHFPNGNKVQVDYTSNRVNIVQVVEDFKSTIAAINAPENVSSEVYSYLSLVEMESKKENPSREIILSNLRNASKISDKFIEDSLKKPSTVVLDWVNALFLQQVDIKADPGFVNEAFRVQIPEDKNAPAGNIDTAVASFDAAIPAAAQYQAPETSGVVTGTGSVLNTVSSAGDFQNSALNIYDIPQNRVTVSEIKNMTYSTTASPAAAFAPTETAVSFEEVSQARIVNTIETVDPGTTPAGRIEAKTAEALVAAIPAAIEAEHNSVYKLSAGAGISVPQDENTVAGTFLQEIRDAKNNFVRAKRIVKENGDPYSALKLYDEALKLVKNSGDENLKAAIHFERGKVFDDYDYAELALKDYNSATKCSDYNLKTHAHLKMGRIYDDYVMFDPALEQYSLALETSEEAQNPSGKTRALRYLAALFADRYDKENTETFNALSIDAAKETGNKKIIAKTLMDAAENFECIGEDTKALATYKEAAKALYDIKDYNLLSKNYENASEIMERLGRGAKAMNLLSKALEYRQKAELQAA